MEGKVIIIMGVSGSGKTTIGEAIADTMGAVFIDGDSLHPQSNIDKMKNGISLTDSDRSVWFDIIIEKANEVRSKEALSVFACSALKRKYRDLLRNGIPGVYFLYLKGLYSNIEEQMEERKHHFMPVSLLESQFNTLEEPGVDETDVKTIIMSNNLQTNIAAAIKAVHIYCNKN